MRALGEQLVVELRLVESTDTLARWMAHYVAELLVSAENATPSGRDEARWLCAQSILQVWEQARRFPARIAGFEAIDRVIETMESLHPDGGPHYRNDLWRSLEGLAANGDDEVGELLATAHAIDGIARNLVHHTLSLAAHRAGRDSVEWLELAKALDDEDPLTELRIRIVTVGHEQAQLDKYRTDELECRIAQLDHFVNATELLRASLVESLATAKAASDFTDEQRSTRTS